MTSLSVRFVTRRGDSKLEIDLEAAAGTSLVLVGPNGAGKTTCLHAIAGLLTLESGTIHVDGSTWNDVGSNVHVPAEDRRVGYVFQDTMLFPHMTVLDNVAFGPRSRGASKKDSVEKAVDHLERVGLRELATRRARTLSGGEAQRVALARALACDPSVLLLDEPLAAVDASARLTLRRLLREQLDLYQGVRIVVAHDALDAFALADRIAVFEDGRVVQTGTVSEVCSLPRSNYVADLVGLNLFRGTSSDGVIEIEGRRSLSSATKLDGPAIATVHPRAVALYRSRPDGSPRNVWRAPIDSLENALDRVRVQIGGELPLVAEVTHSAVRDLELGGGGEVWIAVKATEVVIYPA